MGKRTLGVPGIAQGRGGSAVCVYVLWRLLLCLCLRGEKDTGRREPPRNAACRCGTDSGLFLRENFADKFLYCVKISQRRRMVHLFIHRDASYREPALFVGKFAQQTSFAFIDQHFVKYIRLRNGGLSQCVAAKDIYHRTQIIILGNASGIPRQFRRTVAVVEAHRLGNSAMIFGRIEARERK